MSHSPLAYIAAALALVAVPGCFRRAAESDFLWQRSCDHHQGQLPPGPALERARADCSDNTARYRRKLQRKTLFSFLWVMGFAAAASWLIPWHVPGRFTSLSSPQVFAALSVLAFAWGTLGRLGWSEGSNKGATIFERLDTHIFWLLYGVGTYSGVAGVVSAPA